MAKKAKTKLPDHFEEIEAKHQLKDAEKIELLASMTRYYSERKELEEQFKASAQGWKIRLKEKDLEIAKANNIASAGYEMRKMRARIEFHTPKKGQKSCFDPESGDLIDVREMTHADYELPLFKPDQLPPLQPGEGIVSVEQAVKEAEPSDDAAFD